MTAFDHPVRISVEDDSGSHNVVMVHDYYSDNDREQPTRPVRDQLINLSSTFTYTSFDNPEAVAKELSTMPKVIEKPFSPVSTTEDFFDSQQDDPYHRTLQEFLSREKFHSEMRKRFEDQTGLDMKIITRTKTTDRQHHPNHYAVHHNHHLSSSSSSSSSSLCSASSSLLSVTSKARSSSEKGAQLCHRIRFKPMEKPLLLEYKPHLIKKYQKLETQSSPKGTAAAATPDNTPTGSSSCTNKKCRKPKWTKLPAEEPKFSVEPSAYTPHPIRVNFCGEMVTVDQNSPKSLDESLWI